jgi:large subunit ribosomal protein L17
MRHLKKGGNKLGRSAEHRKSLLRNLMISLIEHRKIQTTKAKAKAVQPAIESLLALAREDTPHARQIAIRVCARAVCRPQRRLYAHHEAWPTTGRWG